MALLIDAGGQSGNGVQLRDLSAATQITLDSGKASYKGLNWTEKGDALAALKGIEDKKFEGKRYSVRKISFEGNKKIHEDKLRMGMVMHDGMPMLATLMEADRKSLIAKYHGLGCIQAQILPDRRYTNEPGVVGCG